MNFLISLLLLGVIMSVLVAIAYFLKPADMPESEFRAKLFGPLKKRTPDDLRSIAMTFSRIGLITVAYPLACFFLPALNVLSLSRETFITLFVAGGMTVIGGTLYRQKNAG